MTTASRPRPSTPDSTAPTRRGLLARLGTTKRAATAARTLYRRELPIVTTPDIRLDTARWLVAYAEAFRREALAVRAEAVRQQLDQAGGWRALEAATGVKESTLRGWAAHRTPEGQP